MMYIDIFNNTSTYKGIERCGGILQVLKKKQLNKYLTLLDDEGRIVFKKENYVTLCEILDSLSSSMAEKFEIVVFGDSDCSGFIMNYPEHKFYGYDITGDSCYLSPIYRAVCENKSEEHRYIHGFLNKYFLCDSIEGCEKIISYVKQCDDDFFEQDGNLHYVAVFALEPIR